MSKAPYLGRLLDCGYSVQIRQGCLTVHFATGNPKRMSKQEAAGLVDEIARLLPIPLLNYRKRR